MYCPKCKGKIGVLDSVYNNDENEILRKRKCKECGHIFYTIEFEVEQDDRLKQEWSSFYRSNLRNN